MIARYLSSHRTFGLEVILASLAVSWGCWLLVPGWQGLLSLYPRSGRLAEWFWGLVLLALGGYWTLGIMASFRRQPRGPVICYEAASVLALIWGLWAAEFAIHNFHLRGLPTVTCLSASLAALTVRWRLGVVLRRHHYPT